MDTRITWILVEDELPFIPENFMQTDEIYLVRAEGKTIPAHIVSGQPSEKEGYWDFRPEVQCKRYWIDATKRGDKASRIIEHVERWARLPE